MTTIGEINDRLRLMKKRAPLASKAAAKAMGLVMQREVVSNELRRYTHQPGVATNSPPGEPPALVTGKLRGSVVVKGPVGARTRWAVVVGGTVVYARIQELGGRTGRGYNTVLPPRPYIKPAAERVIHTGLATRAAVKGWESAMRF